MKKTIVVKIGLQRLLEEEHLREKYHKLRIGLITNHTALADNFETGVEALLEKGYAVKKIFGPEHGFRGDAEAGKSVGDSVDLKTGLPVISLYGASKKLPAGSLEDLDAVAFDLQDIGVRYYTFIYTMAYAMQSCREAGKKFIVLDRPNPVNGINIEGTVLDPAFSSFVGLYPIPNRHGLTVGELAAYFNTECKIGCDLEIIPMSGWKRSMLFTDTGLRWIMPSQNTTGIEMALLYSGTCLVEGTVLSEGRGTTKPFEWIGAPWIDTDKWKAALDRYPHEGVFFRPVSFTPCTSKYKDQLCRGMQVHITDEAGTDFFRTGLIMLESLRKTFPDDFKWIESVKGRYFIDLLAGTDELRKTIDAGGGILEWYASKQPGVDEFRKSRSRILLY